MPEGSIAPESASPSKDSSQSKFRQLTSKVVNRFMGNRSRAQHLSVESNGQSAAIGPTMMQGLEATLTLAGFDTEQYFRDHSVEPTTREEQFSQKMKTFEDLYAEAIRRGISIRAMPQLSEVADMAAWEANNRGIFEGQPQLSEKLVARWKKPGDSTGEKTTMT